MIDLDRIEESCDSLIKQGFGWNNPACTSASAVKEIITRLRQAEKDAARYRWLRDVAGDSDACEALFNAGYDEFDSFIDEAMQRNCEGK